MLQLAGLHVSKLRFYLLIIFKQFFFFLLTLAEKRAFSRLNVAISAGVSKKRNRLKRTSKMNRNFETYKPDKYFIIWQLVYITIGLFVRLAVSVSISLSGDYVLGTCFSFVTSSGRSSVFDSFLVTKHCKTLYFLEQGCVYK